MGVTVILQRAPLKEFKDGGRSGRWGEMVAIRGPKVMKAKAILGARLEAPYRENGDYCLPISSGILQLSVGPEEVKEVKQFTTMERFRADRGAGYYVQLSPKPAPYGMSFEIGNSAVKKLRKDHDGRCFRIHGTKPGPESGILIHEAPQVGWLIGCISPRPLNDFTIAYPNTSSNPASRSMDELIAFVGRSRADLFVVDW